MLTPKPQGKTFLTSNHEMICLAYEEAEKRGFDACYGTWPEGDYYVEVMGCTPEEFADLLKAVEEQLAGGTIIPSEGHQPRTSCGCP